MPLEQMRRRQILRMRSISNHRMRGGQMRPMDRISAVHFSTSRLSDHHPRALRTSRNFSAFAAHSWASGTRDWN
jgi:hypothetical protein